MFPCSRTFYDQRREATRQGVPKMVILQKESKIELLGSKVCRSLSNKINLRERGGGGVTSRKASLISVWKNQRNFEISKNAIPTLLPLSNNYPFKP